MDTRSGLPKKISDRARLWAADLCLAKDAAEADQILELALDDIGCIRDDRSAPQRLADRGRGAWAADARRPPAHSGLRTCDCGDCGATVPARRGTHRGAWHGADTEADVTIHDRHHTGRPARRDGCDDVRFLSGLYLDLYVDTSEEEDESAEQTPLSPKQIECLRWAAAGKSYHDIASIVGISERTVRYHLDNARNVYGFATITQAIVQAAKQLDFDPLDAR